MVISEKYKTLLTYLHLPTKAIVTCMVSEWFYTCYFFEVCWHFIIYFLPINLLYFGFHLRSEHCKSERRLYFRRGNAISKTKNYKKNGVYDQKKVYTTRVLSSAVKARQPLGQLGKTVRTPLSSASYSSRTISIGICPNHRRRNKRPIYAMAHYSHRHSFQSRNLRMSIPITRSMPYWTTYLDGCARSARSWFC